MSYRKPNAVKFTALPGVDEPERQGVSDDLYRNVPIDYNFTGERRLIEARTRKLEPRMDASYVPQKPKVQKFYASNAKK